MVCVAAVGNGAASGVFGKYLPKTACTIRFGHQLLDTCTRGTRNTAVILNADQDGASLQVEERHQPHDETLDREAVPLSSKGRALTLVDEPPQSMPTHPVPQKPVRSTSSSVGRRLGADAHTVTVSVRGQPCVQRISHFDDPCDRVKHRDQRSHVIPVRCEDYDFVVAASRSSGSVDHVAGARLTT